MIFKLDRCNNFNKASNKGGKMRFYVIKRKLFSGITLTSPERKRGNGCAAKKLRLLSLQPTDSAALKRAIFL